MNYRTLGSTGLSISEIGFGCGTTAALMVQGQQNARMRIVARALEQGITYFDTAPVYGNGLSETHLGEDLRQLGAHPIVGTKVALGPNELEDVAGSVVRSVEASLRRLQMESVDIVHLHNRLGPSRMIGGGVAVGPLLSMEDLLGRKGVFEGFESLRRDGKARFFGVCAFGGEVPAVDEAIDSQRFQSLLACYNVLNPTAARPRPEGLSGPDYGQVMERAAKGGMGVVALRVLAAGALAPAGEASGFSIDGRGKTGQQYQQDVARAAALRGLAEELGISPVGLAIQFALQNESVSTVLVGFSAQSHLDEALAAANSRRLPADFDSRLEALYSTDFQVQEPSVIR